jgi:hypothetical protein
MTICLNKHTYSWLWNVVSRHCKLVYFLCCNIIKWPVKRTHIHRLRHFDNLFLQWSCDITRRYHPESHQDYIIIQPRIEWFRIKNLFGLGFLYIFYSLFFFCLFSLHLYLFSFFFLHYRFQYCFFIFKETIIWTGSYS